MEYRSSDDRGVLVICVSGRLDATTSGALANEVRGQIESGGVRIVFDLSALEFISSAGLRVFLMAARAIRDKGSIALAAPVPNVKQLLDITGVANFATVYDTTTEAVENLCQSPQ